MRVKSRMTAALTAISLCLLAFTLPTYVQSTEPRGKPPAQEETTTVRPSTPEETGTVVNNATDEDGKESYTTQTPDEHVFFLAIDEQRTSENIYPPDAVTEKDLLSLTQAKRESEAVEPGPESTPTPKESTNKPGPEPAPRPTKEDNPVGTIFLVLAVAVISSRAGWYFKIYRPRYQTPGLDEEETDFGAEDDEPTEDGDSPPRDEGEPEKEDEE